MNGPHARCVRGCPKRGQARACTIVAFGNKPVGAALAALVR